MRGEGAAVDPQMFPGDDQPRMTVEIDQGRAKDLGLEARDLAAAARLASGGVSVVPAPGGQTIEVRLEPGNVEAQDRLAALSGRTAAGDLIPLARVARAATVPAPSRVYRLGAEPAVRISAAPPAAMSSAAAAAECVEAAAAERERLKLPREYRAVDLTE
jgi:multidrug efflux pump subunit AcrB